ncbi:hypothetical protein [Oceanihabitans sediminis]|uniref:Uncharacterized protein n=1 Tax=Oceanihabitans sediminis TaxID=1812012 RepID=A0A368P3D7_9FLAO|nr:hypothetical protein [Oceanihabitans sediminis]MDX1277955.1 hypothetical protein [Oceanihabitans sediminis]MDX1774136.1 hypothetical protein [Oceanihabitans sediminis]RCU56790.1 hypothetical protein DU428_10570 [Oceanihabitans sediminis]
MNLFNQRKNRKFNFPSKQKREEELSQKESLASQWDEIRSTSKRKGSVFSSLPVMVMFLIAVLILLYVLGSYE